MSAAIVGLGIAAPEFRIPNDSGADLVIAMSHSDPDQRRKVRAIYRRSGVAMRGSVLLEDEQSMSFYPAASDPDFRGPSTQCRSDRFLEEAPLLAIESATQALKRSGLQASEITHIVIVTCTGFGAPGVDISLIDELGLPATTERIQVGFMGCHGAINGLRVANGLVAANSNAKVLVCSVELCSLHYQYGFDADRIVSGALFADGSASAVLVHSESSTNTTAQPPDAELKATGSVLIPNTRDAMTWLIGDHGFEMTLSARVPSAIEECLPGYLDEWLSSQGLSIEEINGWAVHPGGARILNAVQNSLPIDPKALDVSRSVLADYGNMSSATMLFILDRFAQESVPKPWLMLGFGPGLEIEVALLS